MIIGEEKPEKKMLQNKTSRAATKTSTLGVQGKEKKTSSKLTGVQTGLTGAPSKSENSSTSEVRTRPSFKKLLAKYEKEKVVQRQKERPDEAKGTKSKSTSSKQSDPHLHQDNCVVMPNSGPIAP